MTRNNSGKTYYGSFTANALSNSPDGPSISEYPDFIDAYTQVKRACAQAGRDTGIVAPDICEAIVRACDAILTGDYNDQFISKLQAGGSATTTNMNFNEVIAALASETLGDSRAVEAIDDVNHAQSSNDTYPTAMHICLIGRLDAVVAELRQLLSSLLEKAETYGDERRLGRTCLMDAVTLTIGQTHQGQATSVARVISEVESARDALYSVPLGATAIGTGIGAPDGYGRKATEHLAHTTGRPYRQAEDLFDAMANVDEIVAAAHVLRRASMILYKLAADVRLLSSGPQGGFREIKLKKLQAGSSIMPGKVNPTIPEATMTCMIRVRGWVDMVEEAADAGELEINVFEPIFLEAMIGAMDNIIQGSRLFRERCFDAMEWDLDVMATKNTYGTDRFVEVSEAHGYDHAANLRAETDPDSVHIVGDTH
jgi:aspartate ammonia-lyase